MMYTYLARRIGGMLEHFSFTAPVRRVSSTNCVQPPAVGKVGTQDLNASSPVMSGLISADNGLQTSRLKETADPSTPKNSKHPPLSSSVSPSPDQQRTSVGSSSWFDDIGKTDSSLENADVDDDDETVAKPAKKKRRRILSSESDSHDFAEKRNDVSVTASSCSSSQFQPSPIVADKPSAVSAKDRLSVVHAERQEQNRQNAKEDRDVFYLSSDDDEASSVKHNGLEYSKFKAKRTGTSKAAWTSRKGGNKRSLPEVVDLEQSSEEVITSRQAAEEVRNDCADDEDANDNDVKGFRQSDESDSDDEPRARKDPATKQVLVTFFNTATIDELNCVPSISLKLATLIHSLRPFSSFRDLEQKCITSRGMSSNVIAKCEEMLKQQRRLDKLLEECAANSNSLRQDVKSLLKKKSQQSLVPQPESLSKTLQMKKYQVLGLNWLLLMHKNKLNAVLADEMGLGKTIQVIAFFAQLKATGLKETHLVVVPASTLDNWLKEFDTWCPSLRIETYYGALKDREHIRFSILKSGSQNDAPDVILTTYNQVSSTPYDRSFFRKLKLCYAVFDEAHMLKNCVTSRYQSLMTINARRRLLLTGTPLQNDLIELVSLLNFVMPSLFREYELKDVFAVFVLSQLPKKLELCEFCPLLTEQARYVRVIGSIFVLNSHQQSVCKGAIYVFPYTEFEMASIALNSDQVPAQYYTAQTMNLKRNGLFRIYADVVAALRRDREIANSNSASGASRKSSPDASPSQKIEQPDLNGNGDDDKDSGDLSERKASGNASNDASSNVRRNRVGLLMELRKAANHPLLLRTRYSLPRLQEMATLLCKTEEFKDAGLQYVIEDMEVMNDFQLHKLCLKHSVLASYALPPNVISESGKFAALDKILAKVKEEGCKILLFSQFVIMLDILEEHMRLKQHSFLRLDGSTPVIDRQCLIEQFHSDRQTFAFLLSTKAGGLGINLTAANYVLLHDIDYNPYNDRQAEDRVHRLGQAKDVTVVKLLSKGTVEEHMLHIAQQKLRLEEQIVAKQGSSGDDSGDIELLLQKALEQ